MTSAISYDTMSLKYLVSAVGNVIHLIAYSSDKQPKRVISQLFEVHSLVDVS